MDRDLLARLPVVLAVGRRLSFSGAAAELAMSASAVSHAVRTVEERLGTPLFARTTRSVAPTQAGAVLLAALARGLADLDRAVERLGEGSGRIAGLLRLNAPRLALPMALTPILAVLAERHPELTVEVTSDDGFSDIVGGGFDAGIRLGETIAQDMVAVRLTPPFRAVTVAAPAYLARRGSPAAIDDLAGHNCIGFRLLRSGAVYAWDLAQDGRDVAVSVRGSARVTDPLAARDLALAGIGIAYVFEPLVRADLDAGRLALVLPEAAIEEPGLFVYFARPSGEVPKLRAFLDAVRERLRVGPA